MNISLKDRVAIITGAGSGIGRAAAHLFARAGAKVIVADYAVKAGQMVASEIETFADGHAHFVECDVTNEASVKAMVAAAFERFGKLDIAFNNAGGTTDLPSLVEMSEGHWNTSIDVHLKGVWLCTKHVAAQLLKQGNGGAIVNTASVAGLTGMGSGCYAASKHGVVGLTKVAAVEFGGAGIRVNAICPGFTRTPVVAELMETNPSMVEGMISQHALKRAGEPDEVAQAALWLSSDLASFVTGVALPVDGGFLAGP